MIRGMTGFGTAQVSSGAVKAIVEIKSVNHRFLDVIYYLPIGFASLENKIRAIVQKYIERGRVTVSVKITAKPGQAVSFNKDVVRVYLKYAQALNKEFHLKNDLSVADIMQLPGVFETQEVFVEADAFWPQVENGLKKSLEQLIQMRGREGRSLVQDISGQLREMSSRVVKIRSKYRNLLSAKKKNSSADEIVSFEKGSDINEELSRLGHFIDELKLILKKSNSVGKDIDFVAQEMQRETNTIGSKVQDKEVSKSVIALKSSIEKIREQAQNIE
jgi:uncharacterized protein (TIGR00255 family)